MPEERKLSRRISDVLDHMFLPNSVLLQMAKLEIEEKAAKNDLPSPEFLDKIRALKAKQRALEAGGTTSALAPVTAPAPNPPAAVAVAAPGATNNDDTQSKPRANSSKPKSKDDGKPSSTDKKADDEKKDATAADAFTKAQDEKLIEMKIAGKTWKEIETETNKTKEALLARFKEIKPADFDEKAKGAKAQGGAGGGEGKKGSKASQGGQQGGKKDEGGAGGVGNEGGQVQGRKGSNASQGGKEGKKNDSGGAGTGNANAAAFNDEDDDYSWAAPDANWSQEDLDILFPIMKEEHRECFRRVAIRLSEVTNGARQVHPDSIAEKYLGSKPVWE
ncbi:hypothetical protein EJ08DRAFT_675591 [Tothia fuscella]|uniref:Myb-like domain-containing protein n=1 Tax=Tothia fuscella TaxID=1048955 RepID=A0A9P4P1Z4_9PEZI|nr:hypothetical protein EJ08DRAFT_675591 [Tothia fuscella]